MAERFVDSIKLVQPQGPYILGGHSRAGVIAFEMAQQLVKQGQEIALLILFDTYSDWLHPIVRWRRRLNTLMTLHPAEAGTFVGKWLRRRLQQEMQSLPWHAAGQSPNNIRIAFNSYVPKPYPGRITYIQFTFGERWFARWQRLAQGGVEVWRLPGDHAQMMMSAELGVLVDDLLRDL